MADANYSIAIEAALTDDSAGPQLDALTASLIEAGKKSNDYSLAVRRLNDMLESASAASEAANAALSVGADRYSELERDALRAAKAVEVANSKGRLSDGLVQQALNARNALEKYSAELKPLEENAARATAAEKALQAQLGAIEKASKDADKQQLLANHSLRGLREIVQLLPSPLRGVAHSSVEAARAAKGLSFSFGTGTAVLAIAAVAILAVATAVAYATVKLVEGYVEFVRYAAATADAVRSAALTREAFATLSKSTAAAASSFDMITDSTGQSQAQLIDLTKQLREAKVSAANMPAALRAAALAETALGKGGASEFVNKLKEGQLTVAAFADEARTKFGPIVARQMLSLTAQSERFKRLWDSLFDGLKLEPVLGAINTLVSDLARGEPIAEFLRATIGGLFSFVSDHAQAAAFAIEAFFLGFAIESTKAFLAIRPFVGGLGDMFDNLTLFQAAGRAVAGTMIGLAAALGAVVAVAGFIADPFATLRALFSIFQPGLQAAADSIVAFANDLVDMGGNLIKGLADGITAGAHWVVEAITGAVSGAIDAAKSLLGIASPSKVFAEIGGNTAAGFSEGVDGGAGAAQGSMANLVTPGPGVTAPVPAASGGVTSGSKIDLSGAVFNITGVRDAEHAAQKIGEALTALLRGDVESLRGATV